MSTTIHRRADAPTFTLPDTEGGATRSAGRRPGDRDRVHLQPLPLRAGLARPDRRRGARLRRPRRPRSSRSTPTTPSATRATRSTRCASGSGRGGWPLPYLHDESQEVARAYGAKTTPDVFVLDAEGRLRYRGAPDADYEDPSLGRRLAARGARRGAGRRGRRAAPRPSRSAARSSGSSDDAGDDARRARHHDDRQQQRLVALGVDPREGARRIARPATTHTRAAARHRRAGPRSTASASALPGTAPAAGSCHVTVMAGRVGSDRRVDASAISTITRTSAAGGWP